MANYDYIARGVQSPDLTGVAGAINQKNYQNALLKMRKDELDYSRQQDEAAKTKLAEQETLKKVLAASEWALQPGITKDIVAQSIPDAVGLYEQANGPGSWAQSDEATFKQWAMGVRARAASALGMGPPEPQAPGSLYQVQGPQGPQYATAQQAIGQRPYREPKEPRAPGQLYQVVGPDGKPRYVTAEQALGQQPFIKGSDKPPPDPAALVQDAQNVLSAIDNAEALIGSNTTGFIGQKLGGIGGTEAYDLRAALDTVKASIGFDRLQRMREESKTGGALGQVAVRELELLQATIASLDANQSGPQLRANLQRVRRQYEKAMNAYQAAMNQQNGSPQKAKPESNDGWSIEPVE